MIDFRKVLYIPVSIQKKQNSAITLAWMLSNIYNFRFEMSEFYNIANIDINQGIGLEEIRQYLKTKKMYYFDNQVDASINFDYINLLQNDILSGIVYTSYNNDNIPHMSLLTEISQSHFLMLYGNANYNDIKKAENLFIFFVSILPDISKYVKVVSPSGSKLNRYPAHEDDFI
jgi:hypothetical protein